MGEIPSDTAKVVSDQELTEIYAFLQSRPRTPAAKNIPIPNQARVRRPKPLVPQEMFRRRLAKPLKTQISSPLIRVNTEI
jgi:hypothetical protein